MRRKKRLIDENNIVNRVYKMNQQGIPATLNNLEEAYKTRVWVAKHIIHNPNLIKDLVNNALAQGKLLEYSNGVSELEYRTLWTADNIGRSYETDDISNALYFQCLNKAQIFFKNNSFGKGISGREFLMYPNYNGLLSNYSKSSINKQIIKAGIDQGLYRIKCLFCLCFMFIFTNAIN